MLAGGVSFIATAGGASAEGMTLSLEDPGHVARRRIIIHQSTTIRTDAPFTKALVADPKIADVVPLTDHAVYVVGKQIGITHVTITDAAQKLLGVMEVEVTYDTAGLSREISRTVQDADVSVRVANGRLLLTGSVADTEALARVLSLAEQFTENCYGMLNSGMKNQSAGSDTAAKGQEGKSTPGGGVNINFSQKETAQTGEATSVCYSNGITVRAPQQVQLQVRFVEAKRDAARYLGMKWDAESGNFRGGTGNVPGINPDAISLTNNFPTSNVVVPFGEFLTRIIGKGFEVDNLIEMLETRGVARRLAEPNLVALSGDTANFLAGGEYPIPVQSDDNKITVEFKKFGIGLAFTPTVLADRQINLKIEPEVSDIDPNTTVQVANIFIPGLTVRRASTTVELRDGQSFAIAGLLHTKNSKQLHQLPWIGQVPVLGSLFRSASYEKEESDLVIIVTPHLVQPTRPDQKLATPLDDSLPSNDAELFLRGKMENTKKWPSVYGHILDVEDTGCSEPCQVAMTRDGGDYDSYKK